MADPPSELGALQVRLAWALPALAERALGAPGTLSVLAGQS